MKKSYHNRYNPHGFEVDKNEALPVLKTVKRAWKPFLETLDIGDSFFVPAATDKDVVAVQSNVLDAVRRSLMPVSLVSRRVSDGVRFWRIPEDSSVVAIRSTPAIQESRGFV